MGSNNHHLLVDLYSNIESCKPETKSLISKKPIRALEVSQNVFSGLKKTGRKFTIVTNQSLIFLVFMEKYFGGKTGEHLSSKYVVKNSVKHSESSIIA